MQDNVIGGIMKNKKIIINPEWMGYTEKGFPINNVHIILIGILFILLILLKFIK